jgi:hypothetical protein
MRYTNWLDGPIYISVTNLRFMVIFFRHVPKIAKTDYKLRLSARPSVHLLFGCHW